MPKKGANHFSLQEKAIVYEAIEKLTVTMYLALERHADRGVSWQDHDLGSLLFRLREEVEELAEVIPSFNPTVSEMNNVMREAVDVANFALFIFDNALKERDKQLEEFGGDGE